MNNVKKISLVTAFLASSLGIFGCKDKDVGPAIKEDIIKLDTTEAGSFVPVPMVVTGPDKKLKEFYLSKTSSSIAFVKTEEDSVLQMFAHTSVLPKGKAPNGNFAMGSKNGTATFSLEKGGRRYTGSAPDPTTGFEETKFGVSIVNRGYYPGQGNLPAGEIGSGTTLNGSNPSPKALNKFGLN